jgi:hypothetical protein
MVTYTQGTHLTISIVLIAVSIYVVYGSHVGLGGVVRVFASVAVGMGSALAISAVLIACGWSFHWFTRPWLLNGLFRLVSLRTSRHTIRDAHVLVFVHGVAGWVIPVLLPRSCL